MLLPIEFADDFLDAYKELLDIAMQQKPEIAGNYAEARNLIFKQKDEWLNKTTDIHLQAALRTAIREQFIIFKLSARQSIIVGQDNQFYQITGVTSELSDYGLKPREIVIAVLMNYRGYLISDGLFEAFNALVGNGIWSALRASYKAANVLTLLPSTDIAEESSDQTDLFADNTPASTAQAIVLSANHAQLNAKQSAAHKTFNRLSTKLTQLKQELQMWKDELPQIVAIQENEVMPLSQKYDQNRIEMCIFLDSIHGEKLFNKRDKTQLSNIITEILLSCDNALDDENLKTLIKRHSNHDLDAEKEEAAAYAKKMLTEMFGDTFNAMDVDHIDFTDPKKIMEVVQKLSESAQATQDEQMAQKPARKKTAKQQAAEDKRIAAEQELSGSVRNIYRQLAKQLHPDRETDDAQRKVKTELMQEANQAYNANDLLGLLALQLKVAQIDQDGLNQLPDHTLKNFNSILKQQTQELDSELQMIKMQIQTQILEGDYTVDVRNPEQIRRFLRYSVRDIKNSMQGLKQDLEQWKNDLKEVKIFLREWARQ